MVFDSIKRALGGAGGEGRLDELQAEIERLDAAILRRAGELDQKRQGRLLALFPDGPVPGGGEGRYPDIDPVNFEEAIQQSWLLTAATGIIDNFPGAEALLSQLDATFVAFADANHYRVVEGGPYAELLTWEREIAGSWGLEETAPIYVCNGKGTQVLGCKAPIIVIDRGTLDGLAPDEQRFVLATSLGHLFFGNLRIFAFHRLMGILDKLPSMTSVVTRGLGMIPGIGNTISRGFELARTLNNQVIRKTNLVIGQRQHVLCDRLATLALGGQEPAQSYFGKVALGGEGAKDPAARARLIEQGRGVFERFEKGEIDLNMLSVIGPSDAFAALRAHRLDAWWTGEKAQKIAQGFYVTRARLLEHKKQDQAFEEGIKFLEERLIELHKKQSELRAELQRAAAAEDPLT